jgi:hypothetical protein
VLRTEINSSEQTFKEESMKISMESAESCRMCGGGRGVLTANLGADCCTTCFY